MSHHIVIIGSGFGGLFTAQALAERRDVTITLIARTSHHLFQPLLYQVATGILSEGEIAPATREILKRQRNVQVVLAEVTDIDLDARQVTAAALGERYVYAYDSLVVAAGAGQSYFGNDRFAEFAPGMKSIDDALELRGRIFGAFEVAELAAASGRLDDARRAMTFVVVGAGPTGVEMAGQLAELSHRTLRRDFRHIDPTDARIVLVDGATQVLGPFGENLGGRAQRVLEGLGVEVRLGQMVTDVDATGIVMRPTSAPAGDDSQDKRLEALTKVWAAGVQASPLTATLAEQSGATLDRSGRIGVNDDLTLPGHPEVFVVGDMIDLKGLPGVAQVAIQGGQFAAGQITARLDGRPPAQAFEYNDKGSMATVSRFQAIAKVGPLELAGFDAWVMWLGVHLVYLVGFKNRLTTLLHWAVSFIGRGRSERVITHQQVFARQALRRLGSGGGLSLGAPVPWEDAPGVEETPATSDRTA